MGYSFNDFFDEHLANVKSGDEMIEILSRKLQDPSYDKFKSLILQSILIAMNDGFIDNMQQLAIMLDERVDLKELKYKIGGSSIRACSNDDFESEL